MISPAFDLFCRVIDNYGDAGVCWRLAHQLAALGHPVRLWIDQPAVLARMVPALDPTATAGQRIEGVDVLPWDLADQAPPHGVVVEAFACTLPPHYEATLAQQQCLWINLEYLSAESWVEGCHGLPSLQPNGVPKYFYFPGFTASTGGLLREPDLLAHQAQAQRRDRRTRLQALTGIEAGRITTDARCVLLFSYPQAPFAGLCDALAEDATPTWLLVPGGAPAPGLHSTGNLTVARIPFIPQARFDELLWCCDLNFVRGEDSLVRALWSGSPLVWHIYPQEEDAHLVKLEAWMMAAHWPDTTCELLRAWNRHDDDRMQRTLAAALQPDSWAAWTRRSRAWRQELAQQPDLASKLVDFCQQKRQKS